MVNTIKPSKSCGLTPATLPAMVAALLVVTVMPRAHAFLPTPLSVVTTGELATSESDPTAHIIAQTDNQKPQRDLNQVSTTADDQKRHATPTSAQLLSTWRAQVAAKNLAEHTTWRRLLYFLDDKKSLFGKNKHQSLVDDREFFLSDTGQQDSAAELDALLMALANELGVSADNTPKPAATGNSVACRFPARVQWLSDALGIDTADLNTDCPEFDAWMATLAPKQLSVMFAQEYLDNPLSAFAHTLLRIDSPTSAADPNQIHHAYALNDTVDGNPDDSFVIYAIKAMSGGYDNIIEIDPYPQKLAKYLKDDERDAWTYQLDLSADEVRQIMNHVWETKDLSLPYYFTTDNCASEILRLIDVVRPNQSLLSQLPYAVIPSDVIQLLNKEQLLTHTNYTPSDGTLRQAHLNAVKQGRHELGYHNSAAQTYKEIKSAQTNPISSMTSDGQTLLTPDISPVGNNPIDRHSLQMGSVGVGQRGDHAYVDIGLRAGYHDLLDDPLGFPQFFNLEGVSATLRVSETGEDDETDSVALQNFTLIKGRSFNPLNSAKKGKTWGASIEANRVNDGAREAGRDHLVGSVAYESGWSWALGTPKANTGAMPPQLCYALAMGSAQVGRGIYKGYRVGAGMNLGCLYQINNQLRAQAQLTLPYWYHGNSEEAGARGHYWQPISTIGLQYDIDKTQAVRLDASHEWQDRIVANDDIKVSYRRYF